MLLEGGHLQFFVHKKLDPSSYCFFFKLVAWAINIDLNAGLLILITYHFVIFFGHRCCFCCVTNKLFRVWVCWVFLHSFICHVHVIFSFCASKRLGCVHRFKHASNDLLKLWHHMIHTWVDIIYNNYIMNYIRNKKKCSRDYKFIILSQSVRICNVNALLG